ncbi:hypothetical protein CALCODRAFT_510771 [Calocera cornea HHB12733]|uniref:Uncharacterized protein n=1 Tax=Calocera cornea HHB12733 TaxID=1353952 RepID=A0A165EAS0_9BASI|nr:hypothetical protein CALCODRAFT_510771 [Calocera cornea HHB12733]
MWNKQGKPAAVPDAMRMQLDTNLSKSFQTSLRRFKQATGLKVNTYFKNEKRRRTTGSSSPQYHFSDGRLRKSSDLLLAREIMLRENPSIESAIQNTAASKGTKALYVRSSVLKQTWASLDETQQCQLLAQAAEERSRTQSETLMSYDSVKTVLSKQLEMLSEATGCVFSVFVGGIDQAGQPSTIGMSVGRNAYGLTFAEASLRYEDYKDDWARFVHECAYEHPNITFSWETAASFVEVLPPGSVFGNPEEMAPASVVTLYNFILDCQQGSTYRLFGNVPQQHGVLPAVTPTCTQQPSRLDLPNAEWTSPLPPTPYVANEVSVSDTRATTIPEPAEQIEEDLRADPPAQPNTVRMEHKHVGAVPQAEKRHRGSNRKLRVGRSTKRQSSGTGSSGNFATRRQNVETPDQALPRHVGYTWVPLQMLVPTIDDVPLGRGLRAKRPKRQFGS